MINTVMSTGELARHFGCAAWQVRRLYERGLLPPAQRIGRYRYVAVADLPAVGAALARAGYTPHHPTDNPPGPFKCVPGPAPGGDDFTVTETSTGAV
jgi:hypothetical protein